MTITLALTDKQAAALARRSSDKEPAETVASNLIIEQTQAWADADYAATTSALAEKLKDQPQQVLDGIIAQLAQL